MWRVVPNLGRPSQGPESRRNARLVVKDPTYADVAGAWLRYARRIADLSQRELAARAEVPYGVVSRIEAERHSPRLGTVLALLHAVGVHVHLCDCRQQGDSPQQSHNPRRSDSPRYDRAAAAPLPHLRPPAHDEALRDRADRRYPAHLDVRAVERFGDWWGDWPLLSTRAPSVWRHAARERPDHTFDLARKRRDERRQSR